MIRLSACLPVVLVVLLLGSGVGPVAAQQTRTLDIRDGTVAIDGRKVPSEQLPDGLRLDGVEAHYHFVGISRPVVELNGSLYAVGERLKPVSEQDVRGRSVILRGGGQRARPARAVVEDAPVDMEAAHQDYLREMERQSRQLYRQLMRERAMEAEAKERARVVRLLPEGPERQAQIDSLRAALNQIFDLKQANRRREIERLQQQILEIQRRVQQRASMRDPMIEHRMQQLVPSLKPNGSR
jgi:hypothetical protein